MCGKHENWQWVCDHGVQKLNKIGYKQQNKTKEAIKMPRQIGDRYVCEKCGAQLVYEKPCPCPESMPHSEICCGEQMKLVQQTDVAQANNG